MLLTRSPLDPKAPFDLHVLSPPLAFALSQDQTLQFNLCSIFLVSMQTRPFERDLHRTDETIPSSAVRVSKTVLRPGGVRLDVIVRRPRF